MKLYIYRGLDKEKVPKDVTHVIVDNSVTIIKKEAFCQCKHLVSIIMGDSVKRIEMAAFHGCDALRFVRLSRTLEYIGAMAFSYCESLEALFLPSTVTSIKVGAFVVCRSLKLLVLPQDIDLNNVGYAIIGSTGILQIAENAGISKNQPNTWLIHHMDEAPFHKLCYNPSVTTKQINDYLTEHGTGPALQIDPHRGMTPLHMLSMNPNAPADAIASLFNSNMEAIFCTDNQQKTPLQYARDYNVGG
eukprot:834053_1